MTVEHMASSGNVFADLGLSNPEERLVKSKLAAALQRSMKEMGLNQTTASVLTKIPQPKLSKIIRGRFEGISESYLKDALLRLGHDVEYHVKPRHEGLGSTRVLEGA